MGWLDSIIEGITDFGTDYLQSSSSRKNPTWLDRYLPALNLGGNVIGGILDYTGQQDALQAQKDAMDQWMMWMQQNSAANQQQYQSYLDEFYRQPGGNGAPSGYTLVGTNPKLIDKLRIKALQEAQARLEAGYSDALKTLAPYRKSAKRLLPVMEGLYKQGTSNMGDLYNQTLTANPEFESALSQKLGYSDFIWGRK